MPSTDETVTKDLIETLEDGREGFTRAADKLADSDRPDLADTFRSYADQRGRFAQDLRNLAAQYGDNIEEDGSMLGALHRGWMSIKDAVTGDSPQAVLDSAEQGEDHAKSEYRKALGEPISAHLRAVVEDQQLKVIATHDEVKRLRDSALV